MYQDRESSLWQTKAQRKAARLIATAGSPRIVVGVRAFGARGCAAVVAQAYGEHPETAVRRMRWARTAVTGVSGVARPEPMHPPVPAQRAIPLICCAA